MTPDVVVDVGNTRIKRGVRGQDGTLVIDYLDPKAVDLDLSAGMSNFATSPTWVIAGSDPDQVAKLVRWVRCTVHNVVHITSCQHLPIKIDVEYPEKVGLDRLLGAVAANRLRTPGRPAVTVDVGTAVTVNLIDANGTFTGGLILPGVRLMTRSLHDNTAKLPLIDSDGQRFRNHTFPGRSTEDAIHAGVSYAIAGAVRLALDHAKVSEQNPELFLTGGGHTAVADLLKDHRPRRVPTLVLDGLLITAEALP